MKENEITDIILRYLKTSYRASGKLIQNWLLNRYDKKISDITLRTYISILRRQGHLIVANCRGYRLANIEEAREYCRRRKVEINEELLVLDQMLHGKDNLWK